MIVATPGLAGGVAGRRSSVALEGPDGRYSDLELDGMAELRTPSDVCTIELAGGSGFGDPAERDPEAHARDLIEGYVSR